MSDEPRSPFKEFLARLVRVPKREIDEQEQKFKEKRDADDYKEQRRPIVPNPGQPRPH